MGELSPDTTFAKLVEIWLEDIELEDRIAASTRELYERNMRTLVMPAFGHYTLREMSISKIDRFLKAQAKIRDAALVPADRRDGSRQGRRSRSSRRDARPHLVRHHSDSLHRARRARGSCYC